MAEENAAVEKPTEMRREQHVLTAFNAGKADESDIRRVRFEQEFVRQAMATPHALLGGIVTPVMFEYADYRAALEALEFLMKNSNDLKPGDAINDGALHAELSRRHPKYFSGSSGWIFMQELRTLEAPGLEYALNYIAPQLRALYNMGHWSNRFSELARQARVHEMPTEIQNDFRTEADRIAMSHDGTVVGRNSAAWATEAEREEERPNVIPMGIPQIDEPTGGGHGIGELMVIGGGTGDGKSMMALDLCRKQAAMGGKILYISVEDDEVLIRCRVLAGYCGYSPADLRKPPNLRPSHVDPVRVAQAKEQMLAELGERFYFICAHKATCAYVCEQIRKFRGLYGIEAVIVDYLQAIMPDEETGQKANDMALTVSKLKQTARKCGVALILTSQYNRDGYANGVEPTLTSFKWAGEIENETEIAVLIWRDEDGGRHAKIGKLKWAAIPKQKYMIQSNPVTGHFGQWLDDFRKDAPPNNVRRGNFGRNRSRDI